MFISHHICLLALFIPQLYFTPVKDSHPPSNAVKWVIINGCKLRISGSTNVNRFGCEVSDYYHADTIVVYKNQLATQPLAMTGQLSIDVLQFDCVNDLMTKDLRKTLKAKDHPHLNIRFLSLDKLPCWRLKQETIQGMVDIGLAGVVKRYNMSYTFSKDNQAFITLTGTQSVCFSDFNLLPPRKLGGAIRAKDQLDVLFCLKLKIIDINL